MLAARQLWLLTRCRRRGGRQFRSLAADGQHPQQVMPLASDTALDDVGGKVVGAAIELCHLLAVADATTLRRKLGSKHVGDQAEFLVLADRAGDIGLLADVLGSAQQLRMNIAHLVDSQTAAVVLVDQVSASQSMVDHATRRPAQ
jgi:hypothetical protein